MDAPKIFDKLGMSAPRYSAFDLSREQKLSFKMGYLIPTFVEEILPGDQYRVKTESLIRLSPLIAPVMHRINLYMHYFFVPNRIVWNEWETFITGGKDGTSLPTYPTITLNTPALSAVGTLPDYFGIPLNPSSRAYKVSQIPFRAYQQIVTDYYRDPTLDAEFDVHALPSTIIGTSSVLGLRQRAWEKDYFTSALPWTQRGAEVSVDAGINYKTQSDVVTTAGGVPTDSPLDTDSGQLIGGISLENLRLENIDDISILINDLRTSSALQRFLENNARGGYRYIEQLLHRFGVKSDDARLQRAEYLGGGKQPIVISEVLNTTGTASAPQGEMAGHGISAGTTNSFKKYFKEHGYVIGIMSVIPRSGYYQGIDRHWSRLDKLDYYQPEFANLGEQAIRNNELFADRATPELQNGTFAYQQRYAEYKYGKSSVHGEFKDGLEFWHLARKFSSAPTLSASFVKVDPTEQDRIFAVGFEDQIIAQLYHDVKARRPMPYFSNPKLS